MIRIHLGCTKIFLRDYDATLSIFAQTLEDARAAGDDNTGALALNALSAAYDAVGVQHRWADRIDVLQDAAKRFRTTGAKEEEELALQLLLLLSPFFPLAGANALQARLDELQRGKSSS